MRKQLEMLARQLAALPKSRVAPREMTEDELYHHCVLALPEVTQLDMLTAGLLDDGMTQDELKARCDAIAAEKARASGTPLRDLELFWTTARIIEQQNPDSAAVRQWRNTHPRHKALADRGWVYQEPRPPAH